MSHKVFLFQNIIAPYRVPLFEKLGNDPDLDFSVIVLSKNEPNRKEWTQPDDYPFKVYNKPGFSLSRNYEEHVHFKPFLFINLFREKPDVLLISGFSFASLTAVLLKKILKYKIVLWSEATKFTELNISRFRMFCRKFIAGKLDAVIDAGLLSRQYLTDSVFNSRYPPFFNAFNNIDCQKFSNGKGFLKNNNRNYRDFKHNYGKKVILYVGQLVARKGVFELLYVFEKIAKNNKNVSLILLGSGPLEKALKYYCEQHRLSQVFFTGFTGQNDIPKYYQIADVFVLLSHWDCNPLVIFEALASGLPIVASHAVGNTPEFVMDDYNGYVVDPFNSEMVVEKINRIISDQTIINKFGKNSQLLSQKSTYHNSYKIFRRVIFEVMKK